MNDENFQSIVRQRFLPSSFIMQPFKIHPSSFILSPMLGSTLFQPRVPREKEHARSCAVYPFVRWRNGAHLGSMTPRKSQPSKTPEVARENSDISSPLRLWLTLWLRCSGRVGQMVVPRQEIVAGCWSKPSLRCFAPDGLQVRQYSASETPNVR